MIVRGDVFGQRLPDQHRAVVRDVDDRDGANGARAGLRPQQPERAGVLVEQERSGVLADAHRAAGSPLAREQQLAPFDALPLVEIPVTDHPGGLDDQHVAGVRPLLHRLDQPGEVTLPEALLLAPVVVDRRRCEGDGLTVGGTVRVEGVTGEGQQPGAERRRLRGDLRLFQRSGADRDPGLLRPGEEPVAQAQRGDAVVPVVVAQRVEQGLRLIEAAERDEVAGVRVLGDRVGSIGHLALPQLGPHVERLQLLDRVRARPHAHRLAHQRVEVDHDVVA